MGLMVAKIVTHVILYPMNIVERCFHYIVYMQMQPLSLTLKQRVKSFKMKFSLLVLLLQMHVTGLI